VGFTPATKHDKERAEAARSLERQGSSAAQQMLTVQPMSHLPRDGASASGATDWRHAAYSAGSVRRSGGWRRRRRLFKACREMPRSPAATP
jgi:hypothetical protein